MQKPNGTGIGRIIKAARCSMQGFSASWRYESAFRQEATLWETCAGLVSQVYHCFA